MVTNEENEDGKQNEIDKDAEASDSKSDGKDRTERRLQRKARENQKRMSPRSLANVCRGENGPDIAQLESSQERQERRAAESSRLIDFAKIYGLTIDWRPPQIKPFDEGQEHTVWVDKSETVFKLTKHHYQGLALVHAKYGDTELCQGTPSEYFERIALQNDEFKDDIQVIGLKIVNEVVHIATKQPFIKGTEPTDREIGAYLESIGFSENMYGKWENDSVIITDTHSGNFIKRPSGDLVPIDIILLSK